MHGNANVQLKDRLYGNYKQDGVDSDIDSVPKPHDLKINVL